MLTLEMIQDAKKTLEGVARVTPLYESAFINPNANVFIKCENMQVTGSFKLRGAYVKTASLTEEEASKGVIACSAGNHAQGVALAAQKKGIKAACPQALLWLRLKLQRATAQKLFWFPAYMMMLLQRQ